MNTSERVLTSVLAFVMLAGCVTTTTTTGGARPDADKGDAAQLNYELGARYYRQGSYDLARDRLMTAIELNPKNAVAHYTLALTYEKLDNLRLATESYEQAIRIAPRNFDVQNAYAVFLCNQKDYDAASKQFDKAISAEENDNSEVTMTNAGVCMSQKPDNARAESYFRQALERRPNFPDALLQLCLLKFSSEDFLAARAFLERYLSGNAPTAGILYIGVRIEQELGDERARTEYANRILREFPDSREARRILETG